MVEQFNGFGMHLGNLALLSQAQTRPISAENPCVGYFGHPGGSRRWRLVCAGQREH